MPNDIWMQKFVYNTWSVHRWSMKILITRDNRSIQLFYKYHFLWTRIQFSPRSDWRHQRRLCSACSCPPAETCCGHTRQCRSRKSQTPHGVPKRRPPSLGSLPWRWTRSIRHICNRHWVFKDMSCLNDSTLVVDISSRV